MMYYEANHVRSRDRSGARISCEARLKSYAKSTRVGSTSGGRRDKKDLWGPFRRELGMFADEN